MIRPGARGSSSGRQLRKWPSSAASERSSQIEANDNKTLAVWPSRAPKVISGLFGRISRQLIGDGDGSQVSRRISAQAAGWLAGWLARRGLRLRALCAPIGCAAGAQKMGAQIRLEFTTVSSSRAESSKLAERAGREQQAELTSLLLAQSIGRANKSMARARLARAAQLGERGPPNSIGASDQRLAGGAKRARNWSASNRAGRTR